MPFCTQCGTAVSKDHRFCAQCGAALQPSQSAAPVESPHPPRAPVRADPPVRIAESAPTPSVADDATLRQAGSLLWTANDPIGQQRFDEGPTGRRAFVLLMVGVLILLLGLSVVGYRAFRGQPAPAAAVEQTEHLITPPASGAGGPQTPSTTASVATTGDRPPGHEEPRGEPRWTLVAEGTHEATNIDDALGPPDGKAAVIAPGGSIALGSAAGEPFHNGPGADVEVYGPGGKPAQYTIYARDAPASQWIRFDVNRRGFPSAAAGHDMGHHGLRQARQIMIRNDGRADLYIDAVKPRYPVPADHDEGRTDAHKVR